MLKNSWQPTATIETLKKRSKLMKIIRDFFYSRKFLEVDTPLLCKFGVTDPYNDNFTSNYFGQKYYLQTSPEYHLKRLLCAGSGDLFQITKAFRHESAGKHHNPEFTMLEWYRLDWCEQKLIDEVLDLITSILGEISIQRFSYQKLFEQFCNLNPFNITAIQLMNYAIDKNIVNYDLNMDKDSWLALIMSHFIEPKLVELGGACVIYDFPKSQASLAVIKGEVAKRFEIYVNGIELANGFYELTDPSEQLNRFKNDNLQRQSDLKPDMEPDFYFLEALSEGLPQCSGVALGVDRLLMLALKLNTIEQVLSFSINNS